MIGIRAGAIAGLVVGAAVAVPVALGHGSAKVVGDPATGKGIFMANCSACHTLKAAGAKGTIGPNLDKLALPEATIVKQVTVGGSALMGAAGKKYSLQMPGYKKSLSAAQIQDVAAYVYVSTHK